ncbi:MAG: hypothetical protein AAB071_03160 [Bacteroidota bacterium]
MASLNTTHTVFCIFSHLLRLTESASGLSQTPSDSTGTPSGLSQLPSDSTGTPSGLSQTPSGGSRTPLNNSKKLFFSSDSTAKFFR